MRKLALGTVPEWVPKKVALGTFRNRKQDRKHIYVQEKNKLARLGNVPNAETKKKITRVEK